MRTCSHCGKDYPEDVDRCSADGNSLIGEVPPLPAIPPEISPPPARFIPGERQLRIIEVVLVCTVALGASLLASILSLFQGSSGRFNGTYQWGYGILSEVSALGLLWYVLLRRSKSLSDIGFAWKWTDIGWSIVLCVGGYIAYCLVYAAAYYSGFGAIDRGTANSTVADHIFGGGVTVFTMIFLCINPFFEELIARAYLMTEVKHFGKSAMVAVAVSTLFQTAYHLYQGVPLALAAGGNFFLWSLYYAKTNRITPVILAHLYFDVGSTLIYVARH